MRELTTSPINELTFADVVAFCERRYPENIRLEYKREFSSKSPATQIAKEVAAFANTQGGTIIFGIVEEDRRPSEQQLGSELGNNPRATIITACTHSIFPPVLPEISEFLPNPADPARGFLVVRVPMGDELYATENGTGFYIRQADQSEPVRANKEFIEHLLQRKHAGVEQQLCRREANIRRLRNVINLNEHPQRLWITLGPRLTPEPLVDLQILRTQALSWCVSSDWFGKNSPLDLFEGLRCAFDCFYSARSDSHDAGLIDAYGNLALFSDLIHPIPANHLDSDHCKEAKRDNEGNPLGINVSLVIERAIALIRAGKGYYDSVGFVGHLDLRIQFEQIRGISLSYYREDNVARNWATNLLDDDLQFVESISTSQLASELCELFEPLTRRLLCAWGFVEFYKYSPIVIDRAEQYHFGSDRCSCRNKKSKKHEKCFDCRAKQKAESISNS